MSGECHGDALAFFFLAAPAPTRTLLNVQRKQTAPPPPATKKEIMFTWHHHCMQFCASLYDSFVFRPLRALYLNAPAVGQFGGWQGYTAAQICGRLSGQQEVFWTNYPDECETIISNRFYSSVVTVQVLLYFFVMYRIYQIVLTIIGEVGKMVLRRLCGVKRAALSGPKTATHQIYFMAGSGGLSDTNTQLQNALIDGTLVPPDPN